MIVGIPFGQRPNPNEFGHAFDTKENEQKLPVFGDLGQRDVHAALDEEKRGDHSKGDNAELSLKFPVLAEHLGEAQTEDKDGKDRVALAPSAQGHEDEQEKEEQFDF